MVMKWNIEYESIDVEKMQLAFNKYKDSVLIDGIYLKSVLDYTDVNIYNNLKSWRSNIIEGNTTKVKRLKEIIDNDLNDEDNNKISLIPNSTEEDFEIVNLTKAYNSNKVKFNIGSIMNINYILGDKITHNEFNDYRGKLKIFDNYITHDRQKLEYSVYYINFCSYKHVKVELEKLLEFININLPNLKTFSQVLTLASIFNVEFNRIHPFVDGNGRTGRLFMEKIFEHYDYLPIIFSTEGIKSSYKDALRLSDIDKDKYNYSTFINFISKEYHNQSNEFIEIIKNKFS